MAAKLYHFPPSERSLYYVLDKNGTPRAVDATEWGAFFGDIDNRRVALDKVGRVEVSTIFLGLDHGYGEGPPVLFESMIFGGKLDGEVQRYRTIDAARKGHAELVQAVKKARAEK